MKFDVGLKSFKLNILILPLSESREIIAVLLTASNTLSLAWNRTFMNRFRLNLVC